MRKLVRAIARIMKIYEQICEKYEKCAKICENLWTKCETCAKNYENVKKCENCEKCEKLCEQLWKMDKDVDLQDTYSRTTKSFGVVGLNCLDR